MKECTTDIKKDREDHESTRSDKWEDRINTTTKYIIYFLLGFCSTWLYFFKNPIIEIREVTNRVEYIEDIVCRPEIVKEYVYGGCLPSNWK